jgi:hypothetical protein
LHYLAGARRLALTVPKNVLHGAKVVLDAKLPASSYSRQHVERLGQEERHRRE